MCALEASEELYRPSWGRKIHMMRLRFGFITGLVVGYYLGAMAGRERYEQLNRLISKVRRADATHMAAGKAKSVVDSGINRATDEMKHRMHHNSRSDSQTFTPS